MADEEEIQLLLPTAERGVESESEAATGVETRGAGSYFRPSMGLYVNEGGSHTVRVGWM